LEVDQQQLSLQPQLLFPQLFPQLFPLNPFPQQQKRRTMMMSHQQELLPFPELKHMDLSPHLKVFVIVYARVCKRETWPLKFFKSGKITGGMTGYVRI